MTGANKISADAAKMQFDQNIGIYTHLKKKKNPALKHINTLTVYYMQTQGLIDGIAIQ